MQLPVIFADQQVVITFSVSDQLLNGREQSGFLPALTNQLNCRFDNRLNEAS